MGKPRPLPLIMPALFETIEIEQKDKKWL